MKFSWKQWLKFNLYKKFWSVIGGRMWTYIIRDSWVKAEILWIIGLVMVGAVCGYYFGVVTTVTWLAIFGLGVVAGHVWWGKKHIVGQH